MNATNTKSKNAVAKPQQRTDLGKVRNIGFIAHIDAGKTTVTERVLFFTGRTYKIGDIDQGTTVMDFMDLERERGITIASAATAAEWSGHRINIIDTPGHVDFTAEVERSLRVLDGGVVVFDAVAGVQPQSETVWRQADRHGVPRICFINKMDRLGADFQGAIDSIQKRLRANAVAVQLPIGAESSFTGIIDLVTCTAFAYTKDEAIEPEQIQIPDSLAATVDDYRRHLIEKVAETDDELLLKYVSEEDITVEELAAGIRRATVSLQMVPVLCGSALRHRGIHQLLDAAVDYLPSPLDVAAVRGVESKTGDIIEQPASAEAPLTALAFKVIADQHVGRVVYVRVYSGVIRSGATVYNPARRKRERIGRLLRMHASHREEIDEAGPGEIVGAIGLKDVATGHTLCDESRKVLLESIEFPEPALSVAIEPRTRADQEKMDVALARMRDEDPTLTVSADRESGQVTLAGMGELHLEVVVERMLREFGVAAQVGEPRVAYRETITGVAHAQGRFVRQTGGHGQYGDVTLRLEPLGRGEGLEFEVEISGSVLPKEFWGAVEQGFRDAAQTGILEGYPMVDMRAILTDGSWHQVDSSELAFNIAASMAFKAGVPKAGAVLLEPVMRMEVVTPEEFLGDVLADLHARRGQILSMEGQAGTQTVHAFVPLAETFKYATHLRSRTTGRAIFTQELDHYSAVPKSASRVASGVKD